MSTPRTRARAAEGAPAAPVVVTGMGMVTSVGRHAPAACAAIRAGVSRPQRVAHHHALDEETQETRALTGHPVHGYTEGFNGSGLWMRLALGSMKDLLGSAGLPPAPDTDFWRRTGLLAVTPAPEGERFQVDEGGPTLVEDAFLHPLRTRLGLPFGERWVGLGGMDHAGTATAARRAMHLLTHDGAERVLVVAVDSYLDPLTLKWLGAAYRLKTEDLPTGLSPGEAGVCLLLEDARSARRRGALPLAELAAVAVAHEPNSLPSQETNSGLGLATSLRAALDDAAFPERYSGDVFSDLNGETWRAHEWGSALARLADRVGDVRLHLPCASVGDTGAASGALGVCLATHALSCRHTRLASALVVSSGERGAVGSIALRAALAPGGP